MKAHFGGGCGLGLVGGGVGFFLGFLGGGGGVWGGGGGGGCWLGGVLSSKFGGGERKERKGTEFGAICHHVVGEVEGLDILGNSLAEHGGGDSNSKVGSSDGQPIWCLR